MLRAGGRSGSKCVGSGSHSRRLEGMQGPPMNCMENLGHTGSFQVWWETQTWLESQLC